MRVAPNPAFSGDEQLLELWERVTDPVQALEQLHEHWMFIGTDPYYRDLNNALEAMVSRVLEAKREDSPV